MNQTLAGKGIVVTGGAGDIGRAMVRELARRGAMVTALDIRDPAPEDETPLREPGAVTPRLIRADVRDRPALREILAGIDPLDVVIGNAGIVDSAPFLDITDEQWERHLAVNLTGNFYLGQEAARLLVQREHPGQVIFTGSWVQEVPWPEIGAYSASKAALAMMAKTMARELAPHGIRVNVIAPGIVAAGLARHQMETEPQYARRVATVIPLGRMQTPDDVANAAAFLCSDDASYMTGSTLLVDGGCSLFQFD